MDLLLACEDLIPNIVDNIDDTEPVADHDIERWQKLFGFATREEASNAILEWRGDLGRKTLSSKSWAIIKVKFEPSGYDKEAYEYHLASQTSHHLATRPSPKLQDTSSSGNSSYLLKLEGPIPDAEAVQAMASLSCTPKVIQGTQVDDDEQTPDSNSSSSPPSTTIFCLVDGYTKAKLLQALLSPSAKATMAGFRPTFIKTSQMAKKNLSNNSVYPTLGIDTTLPQFRPQSRRPDYRVSQYSLFDFSLPLQNDYPVFYFFYGTLADPNVLARVLGRDGDGSASAAEITYQKARLRCSMGIKSAKWRITTWGGKYKALVDFSSSLGEGDGKSVEGSAFLVKTREEEDALRYYETDRYEVVRCGIELYYGPYGDDEEWQYKRQWILGLTFRFMG